MVRYCFSLDVDDGMLDFKFLDSKRIVLLFCNLLKKCDLLYLSIRTSDAFSKAKIISYP